MIEYTLIVKKFLLFVLCLWFCLRAIYYDTLGYPKLHNEDSDQTAQADLNFQWAHMPKTTFPGPEVIKLFSYSTQLSIKFFMLINLKLLIIAKF